MGSKRIYPGFLVVLVFLSPLLGADGLDKSRYITIDEIKTNMKAYCLTVYEGTKIEKFPLQVVSVFKNFDTGRNMIFVMGLDDRFKSTGTVAGCSGSPVYIDGRLAGALSMGWTMGKDPLYGVTPIEEMMMAGQTEKSVELGGLRSNLVYFSKPLNFAEINHIYIEALRKNQITGAGEYKYLSVPLAISLPQRSFKAGADYFEAAGFMPVAAPAKGGTELNIPQTFEPGSVLAVSLMTGDIMISGVGTVTDVVDGKIYGFGHSMLGQGRTELPISNGYIHTIVSSIFSSFKLGQAGDVIGTLTNDISTAVYGTIGQVPTMIPMTIKIDRFNDISRTYNCQAAKNPVITPALSAFAITSAIIMHDELPEDFTINSRIQIGIDGFEPITGVSTISNTSPFAISNEIAAPIVLLQNNPFKRLSITSIQYEAQVVNKSAVSTIEEITVSKTKVKPAETVEITVQTQRYRGGQEDFIFRIKLPDDIADGQYTINIGGGEDYAKFLVQNKQHNFTAVDIKSLIAALGNSMALSRTGLYLTIPLPPKGIVLDNKELGGLPFTRAVPLSDSRRTVSVKPNADWLEEKIDSRRIFSNAKQVNIVVEK